MLDKISKKFENKRCLITGGASGVGRAACLAFAQSGAYVACADVNAVGASETAKSCGENSVSFELDVTQPESWDRCIEDVVETLGPIDILVNCAGLGRNGDFETFPLEDWNALIAVNLTGTYLGCQAIMRHMRPRGAGVIINISSIASVSGGADIVAYSASKGGVTSLTQAVSMHGAPYGVRCCAIAPTYVDSEMLDPAVEAFPSRQVMLDNMAELIPVGRVATTDDVANAIIMLASDDMSMITGSTLFVDGGQTSGMPSRHAG